MENKTKIIIGAAILGAAMTAATVYTVLKGRKVRFINGNDEGVVYVLLDGENFENGKKYKVSSRK